MIAIEKVSKAFSGKTVLSEISLSLAEHQTHILLGASGSGKSTLLRCILGLLEAESGSIRLDKQPVSRRYQSAIAKISGYVIQNGGLFPHLTAEENIRLGRSSATTTRYESRLHTLVQLVGFDEKLLAKYPSQLSGGQQQRVALVRALVDDPPYLLMDEPLGALDPIIRYHLQNELKTLFKKLNKTVVFVTHDVSEAMFLGDTITLIDHGSVVQHGVPTEFIKNPVNSFVKEFLSSSRPITENLE